VRTGRKAGEVYIAAAYAWLVTDSLTIYGTRLAGRQGHEDFETVNATRTGSQAAMATGRTILAVPQNGFTTAMMTMPTIRTAGTSFMIR
jgi:hypothetical protein